jgi:hypothetical protein
MAQLLQAEQEGRLVSAVAESGGGAVNDIAAALEGPT